MLNPIERPILTIFIIFGLLIVVMYIVAIFHMNFNYRKIEKKSYDKYVDSSYYAICKDIDYDSDTKKAGVYFIIRDDKDGFEYGLNTTLCNAEEFYRSVGKSDTLSKKAGTDTVTVLKANGDTTYTFIPFCNKY